MTGFSFANLGLFTGFGGGLVSAIYSLVLLEILGSATMVGLYSSVYNVAALIIALSFGELLRVFSKSKLFYASLVAIAAVYFMMGFGIKSQTFIMLDFFSIIPLVLIGVLIPLFMADFAGKGGIAALNGRYVLWMNAGWLFAPIIAMAIADITGLRSVFILASFTYLLALVLFRRYGIIEQDKKIPKITPRKTLRSVWRETKAYFRNKDYARVYMISFGNFALRTLRSLYVPIAIIEAGFTKDILGLVLTIGIIPYIIFSEPIGRLAKKYGKAATKSGMAFGFIVYSICSFLLFFASGWTMLLLFVLWHIPAAVQEPLNDPSFFNAAKAGDQARFFGIFNTSKKLPRIFAPLVAAGFIAAFQATGAVWLLAGIIGVLSATLLLGKK